MSTKDYPYKLVMEDDDSKKQTHACNMRVASRITCTLHACMCVAPEAHNEL